MAKLREANQLREQTEQRIGRGLRASRWINRGFMVAGLTLMANLSGDVAEKALREENIDSVTEVFDLEFCLSLAGISANMAGPLYEGMRSSKRCAKYVSNYAVVMGKDESAGLIVAEAVYKDGRMISDQVVDKKAIDQHSEDGEGISEAEHVAPILFSASGLFLGSEYLASNPITESSSSSAVIGFGFIAAGLYAHFHERHVPQQRMEAYIHQLDNIDSAPPLAAPA